AVQSYETLIRDLRSDLDPAQHAKLDLRLKNIQSQLPDAVKCELPVSPSATVIFQGDYATESSPTYVGKASDIHFIHYIRKYVTGDGAWDGRGDGHDDGLPTQSYTHHHSLRAFVTLTQPLLVPSEAEAEQFLDVYLSTIHIAYPFICKSVLLEQFRHFQAGDRGRPDFWPWLGLFSTTQHPI
ncbi:hypothetical protein AnigIFM63604_005665, partial [Aspergillus niger]